MMLMPLLLKLLKMQHLLLLLLLLLLGQYPRHFKNIAKITSSQIFPDDQIALLDLWNAVKFTSIEYAMMGFFESGGGRGFPLDGSIDGGSGGAAVLVAAVIRIGMVDIILPSTDPVVYDCCIVAALAFVNIPDNTIRCCRRCRRACSKWYGIRRFRMIRQLLFQPTHGAFTGIFLQTLLLVSFFGTGVGTLVVDAVIVITVGRCGNVDTVLDGRRRRLTR